MKAIEGTGSVKLFDRIVANYLKDGYFVTVFFKDASLIFLKLSHVNGNRIVAKYDVCTGEYSFR